MKILKLLFCVSMILTFFSCVNTSGVVETDDVDNFVKGVDISSIISLEDSGVEFSDSYGNKKDIFSILKNNGVNYIRVRIWNNPFNTDGNGYGGGNNDLSQAIKIGTRAAKYNMPLLVDFHYSDFWADPSSQKAPKAWDGMSVSDKANALYTFTYTSLTQLITAGVNVGMVQIGNETMGAMCGETVWSNVIKLMKEGCRAVRQVSGEQSKKDSSFNPIKIALHFTSPDSVGSYLWYAGSLKNANVDYDIFASSWYPFWHGTLENLTSVFRDVIALSGKKVMISEFSYPYTLLDGDGYSNNISSFSEVDLPYEVSAKGQSECIKDVISAVASLGDSGIGVFYWEPAWVPVPGDSYAERQILWNSYGSGWASEYAVDYAESAKKWWGGSGWDNQALFDFDGKMLDSLSAFK
ncbi:MAG: hypothetical protein BKP49_10155 [Treponema sp. CETP13]|nr:MAG: hypothetical protein BKP49_10155 [Treponema sp. CETP13]